MFSHQAYELEERAYKELSIRKLNKFWLWMYKHFGVSRAVRAMGGRGREREGEREEEREGEVLEREELVRKEEQGVGSLYRPGFRCNAFPKRNENHFYYIPLGTAAVLAVRRT